MWKRAFILVFVGWTGVADSMGHLAEHHTFAKPRGRVTKLAYLSTKDDGHTAKSE
jgi:hypothetical protein